MPPKKKPTPAKPVPKATLPKGLIVFKMTPTGTKRSCLICNGEGELCTVCGEPPMVCECGTDDRDDPPACEDCEVCHGTGIATADIDAEDLKRRKTATRLTDDLIDDLVECLEAGIQDVTILARFPDVSAGQLAAVKAHRTMGTYKLRTKKQKLKKIKDAFAGLGLED
jgi:CRISPR/Cas system-associated protein Cas10 (large subunit of type III CRISPR-Cas system)